MHRHGPGLSIEALLVKRLQPLVADDDGSDLRLRVPSLLTRSAMSSALMTRSSAAKTGTDKDWDHIPLVM